MISRVGSSGWDVPAGVRAPPRIASTGSGSVPPNSYEHPGLRGTSLLLPQALAGHESDPAPWLRGP
eukprot:9495473-Pyramimonas_sp.AAC.1